MGYGFLSFRKIGDCVARRVSFGCSHGQVVTCAFQELESKMNGDRWNVTDHHMRGIPGTTSCGPDLGEYIYG